MRVYIPTTLPGLAAARKEELVAAAGAIAHAVTPRVREWYIEGDLEELEYAAMAEAAEGSLRLVAGDSSAPPRRVVVAADVPEAAISIAAEGARSAVVLSSGVSLAAVVSIHIDEPEAEPDVSAAVRVLAAADAGDDDALFLLDEAEAHELLWYDVTELPDLV